MGLVVDSNGTEQRHAFWIDDGQDQGQLIDRLAKVLGSFTDYRIFHYGSYETAFLRRLGKTKLHGARVTKSLDQGNGAQLPGRPLSIRSPHQHCRSPQGATWPKQSPASPKQSAPCLPPTRASSRARS